MFLAFLSIIIKEKNALWLRLQQIYPFMLKVI